MSDLAKGVVDGDDPRAVIWGLIRGQWRFAALYAMVDLGIADHLRDGALTVTELTERLDGNAGALGRLLRTVTTLGVVERVGPETYALTEAGRTLCSDAPGSMRTAIVQQGRSPFLEAMGSLANVVRGGRSVFTERYGSTYGYLDQNPAARRDFDEFMTVRSGEIAKAVVAGYDFAGVETIADIGGGSGTILAAILRAHPELRGILFELEPAIEGARAYLTKQGVIDRCELVVGDFFTAVPPADTYVLSNIIHNWGDEESGRVLRNVRNTMPDDGRVLLLDILIPDDDRPHMGKELDMRMMVMFDGGSERQEAEYLALLGEAGLRSTRVIDLPYALSLVEARPV